MSTGFSGSGAEVVTPIGYGTVGYLQVVAFGTDGTSSIASLDLSYNCQHAIVD